MDIVFGNLLDGGGVMPSNMPSRSYQGRAFGARFAGDSIVLGEGSFLSWLFTA